MPNPTVDALAAEYGAIFEDCYDRWSAAAVESKNGVYSADRLVSDVTAHWVDVASAWLLPVNTVLKGLKAVPQIQLTIAAAGGDVTGAIRLPDPGPVVLNGTRLVDPAAVEPPIPANKVFATMSRPHRILVVQIRNTGALTAGTTFHGRIDGTNGARRTIADVFLTVAP